ncbi:hypothetical protein DFQ04_2519 [Algoriphagus boseongensis]|uniref:AAA+ ATPase domain-containing protein n=1 Tax=Algoriphagus boseongensis TaxID=1442587 RepID=A0A4R6T6Y6_9BACT|nr:ATP-binding protein [Algoriphagus boseongensis]TDQ16401.1 hypothetical protein DFQ04_2519 [Algoriphagus boseongensis]
MTQTLEPTKTSREEINSLVDRFLEDFGKFNKGLLLPNAPSSLQEYLQHEGPRLIDSFNLSSDLACSAEESESKEIQASRYLFHFSYPDRFKSILLLLRDCLLQLSIAELRHSEGFISDQTYAKHFSQTQELLGKETEKIAGFFSSEYQTMMGREDLFKQKLESVKHFANPSEIYITQFKSIQNQLSEITHCGSQLRTTSEEFKSISNLVLKMKDEVLEASEFFREKTRICLEELILLEKNEREIDQVISNFDSLLNAAKAQEINSDSKIRQLEDQINLLKEYSIPVDSKEGYLLTKKIDFRKSTQKWMDYKILPELIDLWDNLEALSSHRLNVANRIKNSLSFAKGSSNSNGIQGEISSWNEIFEKENQTSVQNQGPVELIEDLLKGFKVSEVYTQAEYLKVPLQTNFARLTGGSIKKNIWSKTIGNLLSNLGKKVKVVTEDSPHQKLEVALGILETRNEKEIPDHYHALFQNKNFLGDLFMVRRPALEEEIKKVVDHWKKGHARSLAILGPPLSGKSTLLEFAAHLFPAKEVLILQPNENITVEGRKFKTSKDLGQALSFINRSLMNTKKILIIDDLHLWRDEENSLADNASSLIDFVNTNFSKAFVVVGATKSLSLHLDTLMPFSEGFTNLLETKTAKFDEIYKAVMLRHGASHKKIFEKEGIWMTEGQIRKKIYWLAKKHDFNVGAVLQAWIFCTDVQIDGNIRFTEKETHLNDFLKTPELLVIKQCLLFGYSTDLELKNLFTKNYDSQFKPAVRKLLNIGILERNVQGQLLVKNSVRQDLNAVLVYHELLAN